MLLRERQPLGFLEGRCHVGFKKKKKHQTSGGEGWRDGDRVGRIG